MRRRSATHEVSAPALAAGLMELFDDLPDVLFWVKDPGLRIVAVNQAFAEWVDLSRDAILGKTDADLHVPELARVFMDDDRLVLDSGHPLHRKVELLADRYGGVQWRSTSKLPLIDERGTVVGTTGISRPLERPGAPLPAHYAAFSRLVEHARAHLGEGVSVPDIARHAGMSVATLTRRFHEHMRLSPGEFLSQLRISRACHLLAESPGNVAEVALACGYESAAAFSRAFRRQMGVSPSAYRGRGERVPTS